MCLPEELSLASERSSCEISYNQLLLASSTQQTGIICTKCEEGVALVVDGMSHSKERHRMWLGGVEQVVDTFGVVTKVF
jgi:hypothetical protein